VNHLAHALLAVRTGTSIPGNLLGDFVKGRPEDRWDGELLRGIRLHRAVDAFVDLHPAFARSRARISPARRRFAGVLVDLAYDHLLARDWERRGEGTLREFADRVYAELEAAGDILPERMRGFRRYMVDTDLLVAYRERAGIARALAGMSRRMRRPNALAGGEEELDRAGDDLARDLEELLPAVVDAARREAARLATGAGES